MNFNPDDKQSVLDAVQEDGSNLQYASKELQNEKVVVLEAVKKEGLVLCYASDELRNNFEVVAVAMKQNPFSLYLASMEMQNNKNCLHILEKSIREGKVKVNPFMRLWCEKRMEYLEYIESILEDEDWMKENAPQAPSMGKKRKF